MDPKKKERFQEAETALTSNTEETPDPNYLKKDFKKRKIKIISPNKVISTGVSGIIIILLTVIAFMARDSYLISKDKEILYNYCQKLEGVVATQQETVINVEGRNAYLENALDLIEERKKNVKLYEKEIKQVEQANAVIEKRINGD